MDLDVIAAVVEAEEVVELRLVEIPLVVVVTGAVLVFDELVALVGTEEAEVLLVETPALVVMLVRPVVVLDVLAIPVEIVEAVV